MVAIGCLGTPWAFPIAFAIAQEPSKPNIILMLVDDMGVMDTSVACLTDASGQPQRYPLNDFYRTPNIERLARQGIRFSQFNAMSVCSPTRIAIMTGQNAARHRTTNWIAPDKNNVGPNGPPDWNWRGLRSDDVSLPKLLQAGGYRTIHVGKGHFGPRDSVGADPQNLGFDVNVGGASFGQPASYYGAKNYGNIGGDNKKKSPVAVPGLEKYHGTETFLTEALTLEAKTHMTEAVEANKPFFLYFAHYAVHAPFHSDPRFESHYKDSDKPPAAQAFATLIEGMDKSLGDILDHLETLGVAENTLVLFVGDNGSDAPLGHEHAVACAAPLRGKKGSHYEGGVRVPLIAAWGKRDHNKPFQQRLPIPTDRIQTQLASIPDLFPTIAGITGTQIPSDHKVDGARLDTLLVGEPDRTRRESFLMHYPHAPHRSDYWTSYRDGEWKVIYHYFPSAASEGSHYQLFHLWSDPFEQTNLAETRPEELARMMRSMIEELEAADALYPVDSDRQPVRPQLPHP
jgi:arylsulfatase A-like enzyme